MSRFASFLVAIGVGVLSNNVSASQGPWIRSLAHADLQENSSRSSVVVEWDLEPSAQNVTDAWTNELSKKSYAFLTCGLSPDGALSNCDVNEQFPNDKPTEQFFLGMSDFYKASREFLRLYGSQVTKVTMLIRVQNSAGRPVEDLPCPSPFCSTIPAPPEPPPPPTKREGAKECDSKGSASPSGLANRHSSSSHMIAAGNSSRNISHG